MKFPLLSTLLLLTPLAMSDEVQMLDGKVYKNCTIEQESDTSLSLVVPVKKGIKDVIAVQKDQVKLIIRSTPDEKAFAKLAETYDDESTDADRLTTSEAGIKAYEGFVAKYPQSKLKPDADKKMEALKVLIQQEKERLVKEEAERKAAEPSPEELLRGRYDIEAVKLLDTMKLKVKQGNATGAMQSYDHLAKSYAASEAYVEGTVIASKLLPQLSSNLGKMIVIAKAKAEAEEKKKAEERMLERKLQSKMTDEQKAVAKKRVEDRRNAEKAKRDQYRDFQTKLREKKIRWFSPDPGYADSLEDLKRVVEEDLSHVKQELAGKAAQQSESGKATAAFKKAWELVDASKFDEAKEELSIIRSSRVKQEYWVELQAKIMDGIAAAKDADRAKRQEEYAKRMEARKKNQEIRRKKYSVKDIDGDKKEEAKASAVKK